MVMSIAGPVEPDDLGTVAMCEYLLYGLVGWENDPWVDFSRPKAFDAIASALREFRDAGGRTIVDCGGMLLGRNVDLLKNVASSVDVNIIASTGFGAQDTVPGHFLMPLTERAHRDRSQKDVQKKMWVPDASYLGDLYYGELAQGMVASGMIRSKLPAALVRTGSGWTEITEIEDLSLRGAALAAKKTSCAVITYPVSQAERHIEILVAEGLSPECVVVGHCDDGRAVDLERDKRIATMGAYVAYDHVGWEDPASPHAIPDGRRVELVRAMVESGHADRVVLSCGAIAYPIGVPPTKHAFAYLLTDFVPRLKAAGVSDSEIDTMLVKNPRRILTSRSGPREER